MIYTKKFDLDTFPWKFKAASIISKIKDAGRLEEFSKALEGKFDSESDTASECEINDFVAENEVEVLKMCGLDASGKPIGSKRKYKVFLRVTGVVSEEVEADTPEEARKNVVDEFFDSPGDPLFCMDREDVDTVVPVAYDEGGETFDYGPSEEQKAELRNALTGAELWALVRSDFDECGGMDAPTVELFVSEELAKGAMRKEYDLMMSYHEAKQSSSNYCPFDMVMDPQDGVDTCYIKLNDKIESRWHVRKIDFFQK